MTSEAWTEEELQRIDETEELELSAMRRDVWAHISAGGVGKDARRP